MNTPNAVHVAVQVLATRLARCLSAGLLGTALLLGVAPPQAQAAELPDTLQQIRPSIVAIGSLLPTRSPSFRFFGSGFVVGDGNQVATNAHVVAEVFADVSERFVVAIPTPGGGRPQLRMATKEAVDTERDLAVLRIEGPPMRPMVLAENTVVREGQDIAITGFPLVGALGVFPATHKGIVAAITPIGQPFANASQLDARAIRRLNSGLYNVLQLDIVAFPGNSGSPVYLAENGEVVGVVNQVFVKGLKEAAITNPSGITYAIPVAFLKALLGKP